MVLLRPRGLRLAVMPLPVRLSSPARFVGRVPLRQLALLPWHWQPLQRPLLDCWRQACLAQLPAKLRSLPQPVQPDGLPPPVRWQLAGCCFPLPGRHRLLSPWRTDPATSSSAVGLLPALPRKEELPPQAVAAWLWLPSWQALRRVSVARFQAGRWPCRDIQRFAHRPRAYRCVRAPVRTPAPAAPRPPGSSPSTTC